MFEEGVPVSLSAVVQIHFWNPMSWIENLSESCLDDAFLP